MLPQWHVKDPGHSGKSAGGRLHLIMYTPLTQLGCQDEVYLVVNLSIRGMPGCCPRQPAGVESAGKGESVALCGL